MEAMGFCGSSSSTTTTMLAAPSSGMRKGASYCLAPASRFSPLLTRAMAATRSGGTRKVRPLLWDPHIMRREPGILPMAIPFVLPGTTVFPLGEPGPRETRSGTQPVKLLTNVEKLRLLTKAEKAGLLSAAENFGLSLSTVEKLGLLSKAEELGVLSAATDPGTPGTLLTLGLGLLALGPLCVYLVPEQYPWEVALQIVVALASVVGGSAAFAASNFVSNLQRSS
ncbi:hypothetical protein Taro_001402 [Colocasia esculenta]|uniref:Uncharacterized protein n=1 Tax=Colocasia esculenta TaxID=4460 RepID=A0A843TKM5_COLES|nr:hypothetical protein [Colocasia esculenta]